MRVSIIPEDKRIIVDGKTVDLDDNDIRWKFDDEHIHAIQWKNNKGEIEYEDVDGEDPLPNKTFGEDEFDTIVQPYLTFFNQFLTIVEKKELERSILEKEVIANEFNELNLHKLQEEENLLIINDLQNQNREIRKNYQSVSDELDKIEQNKTLNEQELKIKYNREILEKEAELLSERSKKIDDYFREKASDLAKYVDTLTEELEKQKETFLEEKKQFADYINKYKNSIDAEVEDIEKTVSLNEEKRNFDRQLLESRMIQSQEQFDMMKESTELARYNYDLAIQDLELQKKRLEHERINELREFDLRQKELDIEREELFLDVSLRRENDLIDKIDDDEQTSLGEWQTEESSVIENEYLEKQYNKFQDYINEREGVYKDIQDSIRQINMDSNNVDDISSIFDEMEPEDFYKSLTNKDRENQDFPIQKATAWFNKLKEIMEKNEQ